MVAHSMTATCEVSSSRSEFRPISAGLLTPQSVNYEGKCSVARVCVFVYLCVSPLESGFLKQLLYSTQFLPLGWWPLLVSLLIIRVSL